MNKLLNDFRTAMLGVAGGIFTFSIFLLIDRIDSYYIYLSRVSGEGYESYRVVEELWWIPVAFWHVLLFIVASFVAHRYSANRYWSPFLLWQTVGVITLLGWLLTLSIATGLECLMIGSMYPLETAANMFLTWFTVKFAAAVFACNVIYSSLIHSAASQYANPHDEVGEAGDGVQLPANQQPSLIRADR